MDLQEHLLRLDVAHAQQADDLPLGCEHRGHLNRARHHLLARAGPRKDQGVLGGLDLDLVLGRHVLEAFAEEREIRLHEQIEEDRPARVEHHERGRADRLAADQKLVGRHDEHVGDGWIGHGDAGEWLLQLDDLRLPDGDLEPDDALLVGECRHRAHGEHRHEQQPQQNPSPPRRIAHSIASPFHDGVHFFVASVSFTVPSSIQSSDLSRRKKRWLT